MPTIKAVMGGNEEEEMIDRSVALDALPAPEDMMSLADRYRTALEKAAQAQKETLCVPSIPHAERNSVMFQAISVIYRTMREFQASHPYPREIRIVCEDDSILQLYMAVWNLYYAQDKENRMNDGRWD